MNDKYARLFGFLAIFISIGIIALSIWKNTMSLLIIGGIGLVVSVFLVIILSSISIFKEDKKLNIETLKKQGLHIVKCRKCYKENVLEDKFCIFCGEDLVQSDE